MRLDSLRGIFVYSTCTVATDQYPICNKVKDQTITMLHKYDLCKLRNIAASQIVEYDLHKLRNEYCHKLCAMQTQMCSLRTV